MTASTQRTVTSGTTVTAYSFGYAYNLDGTPASETYPSGKVVSFAYDRGGRPVNLAELIGPLTTYVSSVTYEPQGAPAAVVFGNTLTEQSCFSARDELITRRLGTGTQANCAPGTDLLRLTFAYGTATTDNGNLTSQTIAAPSFSQTQYYGYDGVNRLKAASEGAALVGGLTCPTTPSWCQEYGYEAFGNRWVSFSNRTLHMATPTSASNFNAATNRLAGSGITYDNAGNLTAHPFITPSGAMTYNAQNKMTQFTATGVSVAYRYDAKERRVRQDSAGQTTIWVYDAFGQLAAEYATNLTMVQDVYYRTTDHLGSTRIVTNQTAAVVQRRDFFPYGEYIPADSTHGNRQTVTDGGQPTYNTNSGVKQQFTGQQRDDETGLDYFNARNYSAPLGRFLSVDPGNAGATARLPQSWDSYSYVNNQPCRYTDPGGMLIPYDEPDVPAPVVEPPGTCEWCRLILGTIIIQGAGSRPGGVSTSRAHAAAMRGLTTIASGEFKSKPGCVSFFQELAKSSGQGTDADTLMNKVIDIANEIIQNGYIYDGPTSNTILTPDKFPNTASPGVQTVKAWFAVDPKRSGLSQFNGAAIWVRFDQWDGYLDTFANNGTPKAYGLGLLLHEILHKQAVGGGFEHGYGPRGMDRALDASGAPGPVPFQSVYSASRMGRICFE